MADNFLDIVTTGNQFNDAAWRSCVRPPQSILNISSLLSHSFCRQCLLSGVHQAFFCLYQKQRSLEAVGMILHEHFNAPSERQRGVEMLDEEDEETESILSLEAMSWLRWLWFLLGTLSPAIQLMSMSGVRWEQAWKMIFLTSWIINESLIICATANDTFFTVSRTGCISWPGFEQMILSSRYRNFQAKVVTLQYWLAISASVVHTVSLNSAFRVIFRKLRLSSSASWSNCPRLNYFRSFSGPIVSAQAAFLKSVGKLGLSSLYSFILRRLGLASWVTCLHALQYFSSPYRYCT
jgi:hypothetical protein